MDQSFWTLTFVTSLSAVKIVAQPPNSHLHKAASFLMRLGSKSGFVCRICSVALTQLDMSGERSVTLSNCSSLSQSNITWWLPLFWFWFSSWWEIPTSCLQKKHFRYEENMSVVWTESIIKLCCSDCVVVQSHLSYYALKEYVSQEVLLSKQNPISWVLSQIYVLYLKQYVKLLTNKPKPSCVDGCTVSTSGRYTVRGMSVNQVFF